MMKVFTSVFVFDSLHATVNDLEKAVRRQAEHREAAEVTEESCGQVASLELWINSPQNRIGGGPA